MEKQVAGSEQRYIKPANGSSRLQFQNQLDIAWMDKRMEAAQVNRVLQRLKTEEETEKCNRYKISHGELHNAEVACEEDLAREMELMKREKRIEEARRQQIRENSPELRELEQKLRAAYVNRDRMQQIRENEYRKMQELVEKEHNGKILLDAIYSDDEYYRIMEENEIKKKSVYKKDLQEQMILTARQKQCIYEESIIEREKMNEVLRTINDENLREIESKKLIKNKLKHEMETFEAAKNAWKEKQRLLILQEEGKLVDYEKKRSEMAEHRNNQLTEKIKRQQAKSQCIAKQISSEKAQKEERQDMVITLNEHEVLDLNIQNEKLEQELLAARIQDTKFGLLKQMSDHTEKEKQQRYKDQCYHIEIQRKEDLLTKKEIEKKKLHRDRQIEYGMEIRKQMLQNRDKREVERSEEEQRSANVMKHSDIVMSNIMAERKAMIREYAPNALGFLQQGLLRNKNS